jgi:hypothetical protein
MVHASVRSRTALPRIVVLGALALGLAMQACDDDKDLDEVGQDVQRSAEEARRELEPRMDEVRRDISQGASDVAANNISDIDIENDRAVVKTDLDADKTSQARTMCEAAIKNPVLSVDTARVEGKGGRVLAECRES